MKIYRCTFQIVMSPKASVRNKCIIMGIEGNGCVKKRKEEELYRWLKNFWN